MDKKEIYGLIDSIVATVADRNDISEAEARCFVGVALRQNREAFLATVCIPRLGVVGAPAPSEQAPSDATAFAEAA